MAEVYKQPCDEGVIRSGKRTEGASVELRPWILATTILGSSVVSINASAINVALPSLQSALATDVVAVQWVINAYSLVLAALILLGGSLGDHYGRRRVFVLGAAIFGAASLWCGLAPDVGGLIAARAFQGLGGALLTPGSLAIISASFPEAERGRAIGLWSGFTAMTTALGPVLGGYVSDNLSWRWVFLVVVPLVALVLALALWRLPESRDDAASGGLDWGGGALATLGLAGVTYGLLESSNRSFSHPAVFLALAVGALLLIGFVVLESRLASPMLPLELFASSTFSAANALTLLLYAALGAAFFFLPFNLIQVQGYSSTAAGFALLPMILLLTLLSRWAGGLIDRVGARLPLIVGPALAAVGFALLALPGEDAGYWTGFLPGLLVLGLGVAVSVAPLTTAVMNAVPTHQAGTASGVNNAVARLANLLAVAVFGVVMLLVFSASLRSGLEATGLPPEVQATILAERNNLAATAVPAGLDEGHASLAREAIDGAFIVGFRVVMVAAATLAALSALTSALSIRGDGASGAADG